MIEAFKSTLEELIYTDMIILVIDISDPIFELKKKFASCMRTLTEIGVERDIVVFVLNKSDLVYRLEIQEKVKILNLQESKKWISISSLVGNNLNDLKLLIKNIFENQNLQKHSNKKETDYSDPYGN